MMNLEIVSPDKVIFKGEVALIQLPGTSGSFEVLSNHAPMVASLNKGKVKIINEEKKEDYFDIAGGVIEVKGNQVIVLAG